MIEPNQVEALGLDMEKTDLGPAGNEDVWEDIEDAVVDMFGEETKELIAEVMTQH